MRAVAIVVALGVGLACGGDRSAPRPEQKAEPPVDGRSLAELVRAHGPPNELRQRIAYEAGEDQTAAAEAVAEIAVELVRDYATAMRRYDTALGDDDLRAAHAQEGAMRVAHWRLGRLAACATVAADSAKGFDDKLWAALASQVSARWTEQLAGSPERPERFDVLQDVVERGLRRPADARPDDLVGLIATAFDVETYPDGVALAYRGNAEPGLAKQYADYMRSYNAFLNGVEIAYGAAMGSLQ